LWKEGTQYCETGHPWHDGAPVGSLAGTELADYIENTQAALHIADGSRPPAVTATRGAAGVVDCRAGRVLTSRWALMDEMLSRCKKPQDDQNGVARILIIFGKTRLEMRRAGMRNVPLIP
jgi:hypothetical protein